MTTPNTTPTTIPDDAEEQLPPGLTWGLKRSFVRYVSFLPDGGHSVADGASLVHGNFFHFEPAVGSSYDPVTGTGTLRFRGDVRLTGHHGMLFVMIADPWVELRDGVAVLSVVDHREWPDRSHRLDLATLDVPAPAQAGDPWVWPETRAALSADSQWLFNDQYAPGEELDPLFMVVPAEHLA